MYNSNIIIDENGYISAITEYEGLMACYLVSNDKFIEKNFYKRRKVQKFKNKPSYGVVSVLFFFKNNKNEIHTYKSIEYMYEKDNSLSEINCSIICDEKYYRIKYYENKSDITFVTFNGAGSNKDSIGFGKAYILKNRWNLVSVSQSKNSQYQGLSIEEFYKHVNTLVMGKKVFTYGSSLGGYCALYFGGCINATVISASPKNSAHPSINDPRFSSLLFTHKEFNEITPTSNPVYIVYDSNINVDKKFIYEQVLPLYKNPELLALPNASHAVLTKMLASKVLKLYINSIICNSYNNEIAVYIKDKCVD